MVLRFCLSSLALIALSHAAMLVQHPNEAIVRQVDHVLFMTPSGRSLVSLLTETLALPIVFPQAGETWTASTGIGLGNVTLEVFHNPTTPPGEVPRAGRISSLALQPVDLETAIRKLRLRGIAHDAPPPKARKTGEPAPRWTTVGLEGFGHRLFFIQYAFDMDERRARFDRILRERQGGPLGIVRLDEVVIAADRLSEVRPQWTKLLGPPSSRADDVWVTGEGPGIRVVKAEDPRANNLVLAVTNLSRAADALRRLQIAAITTKGEIRIAPGATFGLHLVLHEHRGGSSSRRP